MCEAAAWYEEVAIYEKMTRPDNSSTGWLLFFLFVLVVSPCQKLPFSCGLLERRFGARLGQSWDLLRLALVFPAP